MFLFGLIRLPIEKVLPFQVVLSLAEEAQLQRPELPNELAQIDQVARQPYQTMLTTTTGDPVPPMERLSKFYQRMNRAILDKAVIEQERDRLHHVPLP